MGKQKRRGGVRRGEERLRRRRGREKSSLTISVLWRRLVSGAKTRIISFRTLQRMLRKNFIPILTLSRNKRRPGR
jgi:hypothetical protein